MRSRRPPGCREGSSMKDSALRRPLGAKAEAPGAIARVGGLFALASDVRRWFEPAACTLDLADLCRAHRSERFTYGAISFVPAATRSSDFPSAGRFRRSGAPE